MSDPHYQCAVTGELVMVYRETSTYGRGMDPDELSDEALNNRIT